MVMSDQHAIPNTASDSASKRSLELREFFKITLGRWTEFYRKKDIYALTYQERLATAIRYAGALKLPAGSFVLDAGCGPGFTSVLLAGNGFMVHALDFVQEMACATGQLARDADAGDHVRPTVGDVTRLPFSNEVFDLVVMLGVTEWVPPLNKLVSEAARVLKPGGHLIIAWNNRWALHLIVRPLANPLFSRLRRSIRDFLERRRWHTITFPREYRYSVRDLKTAFRNHGLLYLRGRGIGYGPFPILRWNLPAALGHKLNSFLQRTADTRMRSLHSVARNYVAIARKLETSRGVSARR